MAIGTGPFDLHALLEDYLAAIVAALDTIPDHEADLPSEDQHELDGAPPRSFVSPQAPPTDCCPQLGVYAAQVTNAHAGVKAGEPRVPSILLVGVLHRCVPIGKGEGAKWTPPTVIEQEDAARQLNADGWAMWNHIWNLIDAKQFLTACQGVVFESLVSIPQSGGCAGWQLTVRVQLDGYAETITT